MGVEKGERSLRGLVEVGTEETGRNVDRRGRRTSLSDEIGGRYTDSRSTVVSVVEKFFPIEVYGSCKRGPSHTFS